MFCIACNRYAYSSGLNRNFDSNERFAFTVASNITIYVMTWMTFGLAGATDRVVGPEDASKFRVTLPI